MSNYVKATDFASKDALTTGNPLKLIKGTEINDEFNAIQTAVATKADLASPAFTGNPTAATQATDNNTSRLATTAFVQNQIAADSTNVDITGGTIANVAITGGTISGLTTDLSVADGGTGASTFTANSVVLGNGTSSLAGNMIAPSTSGNVLTSNGTTWTSSAIPDSGIGFGQTWQAVTRTSGTTYTNSTSKPIMIVASIYGINAGLSITVDSVNMGTVNGNYGGSITTIVPVGKTYVITGAWSYLSELR